jgi:glycosyltransferase involved in cell wall biosynthesis
MESEVENLEKFDIGIMPLEDDQYNRLKEGYKLKVYMAMGIPVVCSPVGKNRDIVQDGITGYLAANEEEWVDRLTSLVTSVELRAQMGAAGRARVQECYSLSKAGPRFATWLRDLCTSNQVSLTSPKLG